MTHTTLNNKLILDHIDRNASNNIVSNLRWWSNRRDILFMEVVLMNGLTHMNQIYSVQFKQEEFEDDIMHITNGLSSPSVS